jgi:probable phosphoglycerate mutase
MRDNESRGLDFRPPGGESPREVQARLQPWLLQLARRAEPAGAVVHKGIIRCIYALASGWDMRGETPVEFAWGAMHLFELEADGSLRDCYAALPLAKT